ncbi:sirohydrochlorin cobaltochelatase [Photobacterium chitinilyticum]|uniref:Cobalt chelatase n=1 Tax=Photobacterium chitinilyticum TaxID=2485123 RepID=A0A444JP09_9GAMM|nr:sirohydrochlorin cobaltochelatase [Photobacterium chitinilyticum]RWX54799.1 cobalt chelatase [Photobacterium chitinilyticum]
MKRLRHHNKGTAIVLSCFGSVVEQQRYIALQQRIAERYPNCNVEIAFSSKMVIKKLAQQGEQFQSLPQVLADLDMEGFQRILVVSCYLFPTDEHLQLSNMVQGFRQFSLASIEYTPAIMHHTSHTSAILAALNARFANDSDVNLFIHHGAPLLDNPGHQAIHYCDSLLSKLSAKNFTCSLEGAWPYRLIADSLTQEMLQVAKNTQLSMDEHNVRPRLRLIPLLLVSGNHFVNDLAEIKQNLEPNFDVSVAEPINGDKFCLLDFPDLIAVVEQQITEGLVRLRTPESEVCSG